MDVERCRAGVGVSDVTDHRDAVRAICLVLALCASALVAEAAEPGSATASASADPVADVTAPVAAVEPAAAPVGPSSRSSAAAGGEHRERLQTLATALLDKQRDQKQKAESLAGSTPEQDPSGYADLALLNKSVARLQTNFERAALRGIDIALLDEPVQQVFDWQRETIEIIEPVFESIKSMTRRPRQVAHLKNSIALNDRRLAASSAATSTLASLQEELDGSGQAGLVGELLSRWQLRQDTIEQELLMEQTRLDRLTAENDEGSIVSNVVAGTREFLAGRGLTLFYACVAAIVAWSIMQLAWKLFNDRLSRQQRRHATWYRLLAYSFKLITGLMMLVSGVAVLYVREDVLLMAISFLVLAGLALSLRNILPRFINEGRLLVNLGAVREGEAVTYNGLPWIVMSLNLQTVLRNPALEGVIRLPLGVVSSLVSRPLPDGAEPVLFPTRSDDCILLPDTSFGRIIRQTPELVMLAVRGGMTKTIPTAEFFNLHITNLSRGSHFGIGVTFGLDYELQDRALDEVPDKLRAQITQSMSEAGFADVLDDVIAELKAAGNSSLDFLVWMTFKSSAAPDFFKLERVAQQACVAASNDERWNIPFPHMMVHHRQADNPPTLKSVPSSPRPATDTGTG